MSCIDMQPTEWRSYPHGRRVLVDELVIHFHELVRQTQGRACGVVHTVQQPIISNAPVPVAPGEARQQLEQQDMEGNDAEEGPA